MGRLGASLGALKVTYAPIHRFRGHFKSSAAVPRVTRESDRWIDLSQRVFSMCSEERNVECPGGLWRPGIRIFSLLACH